LQAGGHRFDPGHVHQIFLTAKHLPNSSRSNLNVLAPTVRELCKIEPI
jgi:hypothetical protein